MCKSIDSCNEGNEHGYKIQAAAKILLRNMEEQRYTEAQVACSAEPRLQEAQLQRHTSGFQEQVSADGEGIRNISMSLKTTMFFGVVVDHALPDSQFAPSNSALYRTARWTSNHNPFQSPGTQLDTTQKERLP